MDVKTVFVLMVLGLLVSSPFWGAWLLHHYGRPGYIPYVKDGAPVTCESCGKQLILVEKKLNRSPGTVHNHPELGINTYAVACPEVLKKHPTPIRTYYDVADHTHRVVYVTE